MVECGTPEAPTTWIKTRMRPPCRKHLRLLKGVIAPRRSTHRACSAVPSPDLPAHSTMRWVPSSDQRERDGRRRSLCPDAFCDSAASARFWNSPVPSQDAYAAERIPENPRQSSHLRRFTRQAWHALCFGQRPAKAHARAMFLTGEGEITMADQSGNCSGVGCRLRF